MQSFPNGFEVFFCCQACLICFRKGSRDAKLSSVISAELTPDCKHWSKQLEHSKLLIYVCPRAPSRLNAHRLRLNRGAFQVSACHVSTLRLYNLPHNRMLVTSACITQHGSSNAYICPLRKALRDGRPPFLFYCTQRGYTYKPAQQWLVNKPPEYGGKLSQSLVCPSTKAPERGG